MDLLFSKLPSTHFHVPSSSVSLSPIHVLRLNSLMKFLFPVKESRKEILVILQFLKFCFSSCRFQNHSLYLFLCAADNHQVCTSLQTVLSAVTPGLFNMRNVIKTAPEVYPSLLCIEICSKCKHKKIKENGFIYFTNDNTISKMG